MISPSEILAVATGSIAVTGFVRSAVGSTIYDIKSINRSKTFAQHKNTRAYRKRHNITIVICAHNQPTQIEQLLLSIKSSSYKKYQVIVVNNASTDHTTEVVKNFVKKYSKKNIRIVTKRRKSNWKPAINSVVKKYATGDLIVLIDASYSLDKHALRNISRHFLIDEKLAVLMLNNRVVRSQNIASLLQTYENLTLHQQKKLRFTKSQNNVSTIALKKDAFKLLVSSINADSEQLDISPSSIKLEKSLHHLHYAGNAIIYHFPKIENFKDIYARKINLLSKDFSVKNILQFLKEILFLSQPAIFSYFFVLAIYTSSPILFVVGWTAVIITLSFVIWGDENLNLSNKLRLSFYLPIMYILVILSTFINFVASVIAVLNMITIALVDRVRRSISFFRSRQLQTQE